MLGDVAPFKPRIFAVNKIGHPNGAFVLDPVEGTQKESTSGCMFAPDWM